MYRKIVWCYVIVLTLLDTSLNTKFSAQGKSQGNGVSVHESLIEGISLQEWGKESGEEVGVGGGGGAPRDALALSPAALSFGRRALAAAHALTVTITNTANETIHLASVAGTTPHFHASFFESKTLAPQGNTTFSVVYLGRREGPVAAHLYIHTSRGLHKYPVSAVGVASEWRVWPLVGLRVPHNATLEPLLTLYNPTDTTIQVREVYSSGAWLGLALPEGGEAAPRDRWALPPHTTRALVRLRVRPAPASPATPATTPAQEHPQHAPLTAYIRIAGNMTGGGLVVGVEAVPVPAGEYLSPLHLRLRTRGSRDPPDTVYVSAGSTDAAGARLEARVASAACEPPAPRAPPDAAPASAHASAHAANGAKLEASGVDVTLLTDQLDPRHQMTRVAQLTLHYAKMWASYEATQNKLKGVQNGWGHSEASLAQGAYCAGSLRVGRALLPYSLRLLRGTLSLTPPHLHFVTWNKEEALMVKELMARNEFSEPLRITHVEFPPEVHEMFHTQSFAPVEVPAGETRAACSVRLRAAALASTRTLRATITLHTNLTDYTLPILLYEGTLKFEWEWPNSGDGTLRLGTVSTRSTRVVRARLHNPGPGALCVAHLHARLPPAAAHLRLHDPAHSHSHSRCIEGGGEVRVSLTVVAPQAEGGVWGTVSAHTPHAATEVRVQLRARHGRVRALPLSLPPAAPYVWTRAPLEVENSMPVRMRVAGVTLLSHAGAITYVAHEEGDEVGEGSSSAGSVQFAPEALCHPACYTGLQLDTAEGAAWALRGALPEGALALDAELQRARYAMYARAHHQHRVNFTLHLHTTEVVQIPVAGSGRVTWPSVWSAESARGARAPLAGVGAAGVGAGAGAGGVTLRLRAHNPAALPLLLQPRLAQRTPHLPLGGEEESGCVGCVWSAPSFQLGEWRVTRGAAAAWRLPAGEGEGAPYLLLQPSAEVEFTVHFAPTEAADLAAYFYLRNNLTIVERVLVTGRGAAPSFELGGRKPNSTSPITLEVSECGANGGAGVARRVVVVRNTGRVALRLRAWRVAGEPCAARAFRLEPCQPAALPPGHSLELALSYRADWTRARNTAYLTVRVGNSLARFPLQGLVPARLVRACAAQAPRAPLERSLQLCGLCVCVAALIGVVTVSCLDAERALRRHRVSREALEGHAPLDLRACARPEPAPAPAPAPGLSAPTPAAAGTRRRRTPRRRATAPDPARERRAFERWRAGVCRDAPPGDESRSEEEEGGVGASAGRGAPRGDASSSSPDSSPPPPPIRDGYSSLSRRAEEEEEEEGASTGSESMSPVDEAADEAEADEAADEESSAPARGPYHPPYPLAALRHPDAAHSTHRGLRQRRESAEARRTERKSAEAGADNSSNGGGSGAGARGTGPVRPPRKERAPRRRPASPGAAAAGTVRPSSHAHPRPAPHPHHAHAAPHHALHAPPLRWGASWSDVVSRGNAPNANEGGCGGGAPAPLAPIGSDVRRRLGSHSLFYYGGAPAWSPAPAPAPAAAAAAAHSPGPPDPPSPRRAPGGQYHPHPLTSPVRWISDEADASGAGGFRSLQSLWGSCGEGAAGGAGAWLWGEAAAAAGAAPAGGPGEAVRPPPGFAAPRPLRPYDPFQSLASIWTPAALDWRRDSATPPPAPAAAATTTPPPPPPPGAN